MNIDLLNRIQERVRNAREKYGEFVSIHEFWGVFAEEWIELQEEIRKKEPDWQRVEDEMVDCLTVLVRGYEDIVEYYFPINKDIK